MIRNYQRGSGGGSVDLGPIYSSINALQNEVNLLITITDLSTLTSISGEISGLDELSASVESLSSSVTDINNIVSSLSSDIGCCKTLTNPTESGYLFTDPVLYSGPNIEGSAGSVFNNVNNTYMKGVTWKDYPSTVTSSLQGAAPAYFGSCVIYGVCSFDNVCSASLSANTVTNLIINGVTDVFIYDGSYNSISVNNAKSILCSEAYIYDFISPDCKRLSCNKCRMKDISFDYPSTVTANTSDYRIFINSNTIDNINASVLMIQASRNDIWTANFYLDYDLMQYSVWRACPVYMLSNTINALSVFNNEHGTLTSSTYVITRNDISLDGNIINKVWIDLLCPYKFSYNTIDTLKNTIGVSVYASGNAIQEWDCEISPFSASIHNTSTTASLVHCISNTINKWNLHHGISARYIITNVTLFDKVTAAFDSLPIGAIYNTVDYATFDVLSPLTFNMYSRIQSAHINVANDVTVSVSGSIGTLNMVKNERFVSAARNVAIHAFRAHSVGATNVYPDFNATGATIDLLNMYMDDGLLTNFVLSDVSINSANIKNLCSTIVTDKFDISSCSIDYLNYEQHAGRRLRVSSNTIDYCSINGGIVIANFNSCKNMNVFVDEGALHDNTAAAFGGLCLQFTAYRDSFNVGGFYYSTSTGAGNTIVRLNNSF